MDTNTVIVFGILAIIVIVVAWLFRDRLDVLLKGPLGFLFNLKASNRPSTSPPGARIIGSTAEEGGASARANRGEEARVEKTRVKKDIEATTQSTRTNRPKGRPPKPKGVRGQQ